MKIKTVIQIAVSIIAGVWIICASMMIGVNHMRKNQAPDNSLPPLTTGSVVTTVPPATVPASDAAEEPGTVGEQTTIGANNSNPTENVTVGDPAWLVYERESEAASKKAAEEESKKAANSGRAPKTKSEIIVAYANAVNSLKAEPNFKLTKTNKFNVTLDNITGGSIVKGMAETIIKNNTSADPVTYTFKDGIAVETGEKQYGASPNQAIAPSGKSAFIDEDFVKKAECKPNKDGGYTLKIFLKDETQTLNSDAVNHANCMETISLETLGLPSNAKVESMNISYKNSYIEAVLGADGKITAMKHYISVPAATGTGSLGVSVEMKAHGDFLSEYVIKY